MSSSRARTAVAHVACDTCRQRKVRCDEQRPKCSLCRRLNVECQYKERAVEKSAQAPEEAVTRILNTVERLEAKFDNLSFASGSTASPTILTRSSGRSSPPQTPGLAESSTGRSRSTTAVRPAGYVHGSQPRPQLTVPHQVYLWPCVQSQLMTLGPSFNIAEDLQAMAEGGTPWLLKQEFAKHPNGLPFDVGLPSSPSSIGWNAPGYFSRVYYPDLTTQQIERYTEAYFNTFNVIHPVLDYGYFTSNVLTTVLATGVGYGDPGSVLALLVFALGQLAVEGVSGGPIAELDEASGIRGGTAERPPGLQIFNEARARIGSLPLQNDVMDVQLLLLQAAYFEANACHVEYWRSTVAASMACLALIQAPGIDWSSPNGDLIKRAYWICVLNEDLYHLDLDLPRTAIHDFGDSVAFPDFIEHDQQRRPPENIENRPRIQYFFLARISLKRLISRVHEAVHIYAEEHSTDHGGPPVHVVREISRQLDEWREFLPGPLQWDDEHVSIPSPDRSSGQPLDFQHGLDVITAELRTRFYYARFILFRPFIFKALHFADLMSPYDVECAAFAIKAVSLWPIAMSPTKYKKRLIPHLFTWTQNFVGILLILWVLQQNEDLGGPYREQLDRSEIQESITSIWQWMDDMRQIDGIAEWSWQILEPLFTRR